ncbi:major facilitator superfamily MFS_1 [Oscillatoria nigro-viridis PCC 7112]|uniref:Major facilitator superfamily MFS_1 n=1 Tax=Phormidium nigroviride PCC 7112 TaxID=179408 RepID=K9VE61_9CYAN|nr:MFS transporter [Oscillatoria nigro-viridis]AFZ05520.1 major facilitator superfamily MFS_1 [Oscillatoria nigro-viridis PCC 7112]
MHPASPPPDRSGLDALLRNRPFLALWTGQLLAQVADKIFYVLLIILLKTGDYRPWPVSWQHSENSMLSAVMIAYTVPAIVFGSAAGIVVDRFCKKQMLIACNVIRAALIVALPFLPKAFVVLLTMTFLISTVTQFFAPAEQAAIPLAVGREGLMSANALFASSTMGGIIVGMTIGEPLFSWVKHSFGADSQEFLLGGLYLISAGLIYTMRIKESRAGGSGKNVHPWQDLKEGLRYLKHNHLVSNAMVQLTILYSVFAALQVLAIALSGKIGLKETQFGFLLAAAGVGMVFGAAFLGHWGHRMHHKPLPLIGFLMMGFVLAMFAFTRQLWVGFGLSALFGFGASLINGPMQALIQEKTPESMRGKVFGLENNAINIALSLPLAITGPLTDAVSKSVGSDDKGLRIVLLSLGFLVSVMGMAAWKNTRKVLQDVL